MDINNLATPSGSDIYYDQSFRIVLEDHMTYLRNHAETRILTIESVYAYKYEGDLFGLLYHYNIPFHLHWIIMRMNDLTSPTQTRDTLFQLKIPNPRIIERIKNTHMTRFTDIS